MRPSPVSERNAGRDEADRFDCDLPRPGIGLRRGEPAADDVVPSLTPLPRRRQLIGILGEECLEELGVLSHSHGADGREEFHVLPATEHGHLYCRSCGGQWELDSDDRSVVAAVEAFDAGRGFEVDVSHITLIGTCAACRAANASPD